MAAEIRAQSDAILAANEEDLRNAKGRDAAFLDRLRLTPKLVEQMAAGVEAVVALEDPVGKISDRVRRPTGIEVARMRVPLGVVGIIYESRPNVTADAAALCIKSGNACILRGGSESLASNRAIAACVRAGLKSAGLPETAVQLVDSADRAAVGALITLHGIRRHHRAARRQGADRAPVARVEDPDDQAPRRRLPRLRRRQRRRGDGGEASPTTPRRSATAPATPWKRCWWRRESRQRFCPASVRSIRARAWRCAPTTRP